MRSLELECISLEALIFIFLEHLVLSAECSGSHRGSRSKWCVTCTDFSCTMEVSSQVGEALVFVLDRHRLSAQALSFIRLAGLGNISCITYFETLVFLLS